MAENTEMRTNSRTDGVAEVFAERLRDAMTKRGIRHSSAALGRHVGRSTQIAHKWLTAQTNYPGAVDVLLLADALGVSPRWLVGLSDDPAPRRTLKPCQLRAIDLLEAFERLGDLGGEWSDSWIEDGYRLYDRLTPHATAASPYAKSDPFHAKSRK